jgi:hypothetical protein
MGGKRKEPISSEVTIDQIAKKLGLLDKQLTPDEKAVLSAIFRQAGNTLSGAMGPGKCQAHEITIPADAKIAIAYEVEGQIPSIADVFRSSFQPGKACGFKFHSLEIDAAIASGRRPSASKCVAVAAAKCVAVAAT